VKSYPEYKSSEVIWVKQLPEDWSELRVKYFAVFRNGYSFKGTDFSEDQEYPVVRIGDLENGRINLENTMKVSLQTYEETKKFVNKKGDILLALTGATIGKSAIYDINEISLLNQRVAALRPNRKADIKFLKYLIESPEFLTFIDFECYGGAQENIGKGQITSAKFPIPSLAEQQKIVDFLDCKMGQCDRFISNRQKQIELLNEQLHFKINQAITKGINSQVKFKPTDIKYVPEIPEHWDIRKFKSLTFILTCGVAATPEYVEESEGVAFLSAQNCRPFAMDLSKYNYIKPSLHRQLTKYKKPQRGDVLVTRVGAGIGQSCIIDTDLEFSVYVSLTHIRPNKEILSEYIVYFFNTEYCYQLNHEGTVVAGGQGNLNVKNVERYRIPLPPIAEQKEIVNYLDNYRQEIGNLISKYQQQIELMQEYRTALISQAVTGKIDVRDWKPQTK
jgi:type I restriction enzyme S subunit